MEGHGNSMEPQNSETEDKGPDFEIVGEPDKEQFQLPEIFLSPSEVAMHVKDVESKVAGAIDESKQVDLDKLRDHELIDLLKKGEFIMDEEFLQRADLKISVPPGYKICPVIVPVTNAGTKFDEQAIADGECLIFWWWMTKGRRSQIMQRILTFSINFPMRI